MKHPKHSLERPLKPDSRDRVEPVRGSGIKEALLRSADVVPALEGLIQGARRLNAAGALLLQVRLAPGSETGRIRSKRQSYSSIENHTNKRPFRSVRKFGLLQTLPYADTTLQVVSLEIS